MTIQTCDHRLVTPDGSALALTETYVPDAKTTVLILHGFMSNRKSPNATAVAEQCSRMGMTAITVDFYGRGDSDGTFGDLTIAKAVENVMAVRAFVHERDPDQDIILAGGSFGGLVAMHAAAALPNLKALIMRAPASDWRAIWAGWLSPAEFAAWDRIGTHTGDVAPGHTVTFGREFFVETQAPPVYDTLIEKLTVPTLIVHGDADETVPLAQSQKLHSLLPNSRLVVLPGADHGFSQPEDLEAYQHLIEEFLVL